MILKVSWSLLSTLIVEELVESLKAHKLRKKRKRRNPTIKHYTHFDSNGALQTL